VEAEERNKSSMAVWYSSRKLQKAESRTRWIDYGLGMLLLKSRQRSRGGIERSAAVGSVSN